MGRFPVSEAKETDLLLLMEKYGIREQDLEESFTLGSGPGGQKINKTASCVLLKHLPTGIQVRCQKTRSQALNRYFARRRLVEVIEQQLEGQKSREQQKREKIRRQKRRRSKRAKDKMLQNKKKQGIKKQLRRTLPKE